MRGTDFLVIVEPSGETRVVVYEGLVEVSSLVNPLQTVLVRPGRNVVVRPGGDIGLVSAGPGSQLYGGPNVGGVGRTFEVLSYSSDFASYRINDQVTFFPLRFTAFSDSHFDSLQNPAFASDFRSAESRIYFLSSMSRPSLATGGLPYRTEPADYLNHTASGQSSLFIPIGDSRTVVGGSVAMAQTWLNAAEKTREYKPYFNDRYYGFRENGGNYDYKETIPVKDFVTVHVGGQKEFRKRLLASGSFLYSSGCCVSIYPLLTSINVRNDYPRRYLNLSAGWRIKPNWIAQYAYSSDFGTSLPSHTLMFRYDLGRNREK